MRDAFQPTVYLLANGPHGTLYIGVTSNLFQRLHQHRISATSGFTSRYHITSLVWFEQHGTMETAIQREKRLKKWCRDWKLRLIEAANPEWVDLAIGLGFEPVAKKP